MDLSVPDHAVDFLEEGKNRSPRSRMRAFDEIKIKGTAGKLRRESFTKMVEKSVLESALDLVQRTRIWFDFFFRVAQVLSYNR